MRLSYLPFSAVIGAVGAVVLITAVIEAPHRRPAHALAVTPEPDPQGH